MNLNNAHYYPKITKNNNSIQNRFASSLQYMLSALAQNSNNYVQDKLNLGFSEGFTGGGFARPFETIDFSETTESPPVRKARKNPQKRKRSSTKKKSVAKSNLKGKKSKQKKKKATKKKTNNSLF